MQEMTVPSLGRENPLGKKKSPCTILAWEIPQTEEPGGLQFKVTKSWTRLSD